MAGPEAQACRRIVHWLEKGQPADVIQMRVAEQQIRIDRRVLRRQSDAQVTQPRAGIEDHEMGTAAQPNERDVAAIAYRCWPGRRQAAPDAPEPPPHLNVVPQSCAGPKPASRYRQVCTQ